MCTVYIVQHIQHTERTHNMANANGWMDGWLAGWLFASVSLLSLRIVVITFFTSPHTHTHSLTYRHAAMFSTHTHTHSHLIYKYKYKYNKYKYMYVCMYVRIVHILDRTYRMRRAYKHLLIHV